MSRRQQLERSRDNTDPRMRWAEHRLKIARKRIQLRGRRTLAPSSGDGPGEQTVEIDHGATHGARIAKLFAQGTSCKALGVGGVAGVQKHFQARPNERKRCERRHAPGFELCVESVAAHLPRLARTVGQRDGLRERAK